MSIIKKGEISKINICHFIWICNACGHKTTVDLSDDLDNMPCIEKIENNENAKGDIKCPKCENGIMSFE